MQFRKEDDENYNLDMTPMIDMVFLLLIFFMVSTTFVDFSRRMDISLPASKTSAPDEEPKTLVIEMTKDKRIFLRGKEMTVSGLEASLVNLPQDGRPGSIIKADKDLPYGDVVNVMGVLQKAGVHDISVAVK